MHGLVNRAIEGFLSDTYGPATARRIMTEAGAPDGFEAMKHDDALTDAVLSAAARNLGKPRVALLEDLGTYLIWHPKVPAVRRLLRFCGADFAEFVASLADLPARVRLAFPDLVLPAIEVRGRGPGAFSLSIDPDFGFGPFLAGVLQAMADDYGTLATLELGGDGAGAAILHVAIHDADFGQGRAFHLASGVA